MEQTRSDHRSGLSRGVPDTALYPPAHPNQNQEKIQKDFIYLSAKTVGVDLMLATNGAPITSYQLDALYVAGFLDYPSHDVLNSYFDDIEDFNDDVYAAYERKVNRRAQREAELIKEMDGAGVPSILYRDIDFVAIEGLSKIKDGNLVRDIGQIQSDEVDQQTKLSRYLKYQLAKRLLVAAGKEPDEHRLAGIALGIYLRDGEQFGKKISSFQSEVNKASDGFISQAEVELAADATKIYDYIYPERRKKFLKELSTTANKPIVLPLDEAKKAYNLNPELEVSIDFNRKALLIGEVAVNHVLESGYRTNQIHKLGGLLLKGPGDYNLSSANAYEYAKWSKEDCIEYGRWLVNILNEYDSDLTARRITNAHRLGIGPGIRTLFYKHFTGARDFYKAVGATKRKKGRFAHWGADEWLAWSQRVRADNGGRFTDEIIKANSLENPDDPTLRIAKLHSSIAEFDRGVGQKPYNEKMTFEQCMDMIFKFVDEKHRLPHRKEYKPAFGLPSLNSIYMHCGGMANVRRIVNEQLANGEDLADSALAA